MPPETPVIVQLEPEGGFYCDDCDLERVMDDPLEHYRTVHGLTDPLDLMVVAPEDA
jgi:hypothetical protein